MRKKVHNNRIGGGDGIVSEKNLTLRISRCCSCSNQFDGKKSV